MIKKRFFKKPAERNLITLFIAVFVFILFVLLFIAAFGVRGKETPPKLNSTQKDEKEKKLKELKAKRDLFQLSRLLLARRIIKVRAIDRWIVRTVDKGFRWFRWGLFLVTGTIFLTIWIEPLNFLGWTTAGFLKGINATGVLLLLLFFASSEENDSLIKCYHRAKPKCVQFCRKFVKWRLEPGVSDDIDNIDKLLIERNELFIQFEIISTEIRTLHKK